MEEVKGKRIANGKKEYLIKWKGFGEDECTWEPVSNLEACSKMIAKYEKDHGSAVEEKTGAGSKSTKPDKKKLKGKEDGGSDVPASKQTAETRRGTGKSSQIEEEKDKTECQYEVLKRTSIDSEIVFKVMDLATKKEQFMSRKDLIREDPVALCLFYEKHIVS